MQATLLTPPSTPVREPEPPASGDSPKESTVKNVEEADTTAPESPPLSSTPINGNLNVLPVPSYCVVM